MNFENLQKDLFERKLKLEEYFSKTFKLLKVFLKENKSECKNFSKISSAFHPLAQYAPVKAPALTP